MAPQVSGARKHRRGMRPAEEGRPLPQKHIDDLTIKRENAAVRPLSVEAAEFSLRSGPRTQVTAGVGSDGGVTPLQPIPTRGVIRGDAVVSTATEVGAVALSNFAGAVAPVDLARITVPAIAGMIFSDVAEVHSSAVDNEGDPSVVCASRQRSAIGLDPRAAPANDGRPMEGLSVLEPLEHSVLEVALDGRPMEGISVLEPLEHSVLEVALDRGDSSLVKVDVSDPLEHSSLT